MLALTVKPTHGQAQETITVSEQVFYDELTPYGQWVEDEEYGYVWVPDVDDGFRPYFTNGHWVMTEYGNTWVSSYSWGWAPFHYGRWVYDYYYGWMWVPGYEWGPAWVCWRYGGGYYGWAPLGPWFAVTVTFGAYNCPGNWWVFIPQHHIYHRHYIYEPRYDRVINNTTIINNTYINQRNKTTYVVGPRVDEVRAATGTDVTIHTLVPARRPGLTRTEQQKVEIYNPEIDKQEDRSLTKPNSTVKSRRTIEKEPQPVREPGDTRPVYKQERTKLEPAIPQRSPVETKPAPVQRQPTVPVQQPVPRQRVPETPRKEPVHTIPGKAPAQQREPVRQPSKPASRPAPAVRPVERTPAPVQRKEMQQPAQPMERPRTR